MPSNSQKISPPPLQEAPSTDEELDSFEDDSFDDSAPSLSNERTQVNISLPAFHEDPAAEPVDPLAFQLEPGTVVGEYVIEERIGIGAMGEVWLAQQPLIKRWAAFKILRKKISEEEEAVARFIQEARAVNAIKHRGLIDIYSFGELPDGRPYFVMEYLKGKTLGQLLEERGPLSWRDIANIGLQTCEALQAVHDQGIVHRDLKSENIFLVLEEEADPQVKLLDFGIAKLVQAEDEDARLTRAGDIFGTPAYMSPEHCRGRVTYHSDIYSFGTLLFEMICGRTPFFEPGLKATDVLLRQISEPAPPPSKMVSGRPVPSQVDALVLRTLEKEPQDRPASCTHLAEDLARVLGPLAEQEDPEALGQAKPIFGVATSTLALRRKAFPPAQKARSPWPFLFASLTTLALGGALTLLLLPPNTSAPPQAVVPLAKAPPPPPLAPSLPSVVRLSLETVPSGADVYLEEELLGETPLDEELPYGEEEITLVLEKKGYREETVSLTPNVDNRFKVDLSRERRGKAHERPRKPKKAPPDEEKKPPRPIDKDGLPDSPF